MAPKRERVSKVRITVKQGGERWYLLSKKRARSREEKHGKLEMLGGHLDPCETPRDALIRELREEETSGLLSQRARSTELDVHELDVGGAHHYLYGLDITEEEFESLKPNPKESLGFELLRAAELEAGTLHASLTPRTRKILDALAKSENKS